MNKGLQITLYVVCAYLLVFGLLFLLAPGLAAQTKNWQQFRGGRVDGVGEGATQDVRRRLPGPHVHGRQEPALR